MFGSRIKRAEGEKWPAYQERQRADSAAQEAVAKPKRKRAVKTKKIAEPPQDTQ